MTTADEKMREDVSLLRKYAYEFGLTNDIEMHTMMLEAQKRIIDSAAQSAERIKLLEQQNEQLQAQVARLTDSLVKIKWHRKPGGSPTKYEYEIECIAHDSLSASTQTAEAYKRRVQVEALESAKTRLLDQLGNPYQESADVILRRMISEIK